MGASLQAEKSLTGSIIKKKNLSGSITTDKVVSGALGTAGVKYVDDYERLINRPQINEIELIGNKSLEDLGIMSDSRVETKTTAEWNSIPGLVSESGKIYIYSDCKSVVVDEQTVNIPGIKIGDGLAYLIDLPFTTSGSDAEFADHMADTDIHITPEERSNWNNKVTVYYSGNREELVLSKDVLANAELGD